MTSIAKIFETAVAADEGWGGVGTKGRPASGPAGAFDEGARDYKPTITITGPALDKPGII